MGRAGKKQENNEEWVLPENTHDHSLSSLKKAPQSVNPNRKKNPHSKSKHHHNSYKASDLDQNKEATYSGRHNNKPVGVRAEKQKVNVAKKTAYCPTKTQYGRRREESETYAALDLGTNNCRLLVAKKTRNYFRVISSFSRIVRLGEGAGETNKISALAADRALIALQACAKKIKQQNVTRTWLVATQACRGSLNGVDFINTVKEQTGLEIEIISAEKEAELALMGCANLIDPESHGTLVFDVGGGSSELIWVDQSSQKDFHPKTIKQNIEDWTSLPLGVVSLSEMFGDKEISAQFYSEMVEIVKEKLRDFQSFERLKSIAAQKDITLLGTSGTVTTIAGLYLKLKKYDRNRVDGIWLNRGEIRAITNQVAKMSYEERCNNPCIGRDRADLVVAGCAMVEAVLSSWNIERIRVADRGLREGLLLSMMREDDRA